MSTAVKKVHLSRGVRAQIVRATHRLLSVESKVFESKSTPGQTYMARVEADGKVFCNCRGWVVRKQGKPRQCWHTQQLLGERQTKSDGEFLFLVKEGT